MLPIGFVGILYILYDLIQVFVIFRNFTIEKIKKKYWKQIKIAHEIKYSISI